MKKLYNALIFASLCTQYMVASAKRIPTSGPNLDIEVYKCVLRNFDKNCTGTENMHEKNSDTCLNLINMIRDIESLFENKYGWYSFEIIDPLITEKRTTAIDYFTQHKKQ